MRGMYLIGFVLALPPLAALGHDLYLAYGQEGTAIDLEQPFHFSDIGWLWKTYALDSFDSMKESVDPQTWQNWIRPVLEQTAVVATGLPFAIFFATMLTLKVMRSGWIALQMGGKKLTGKGYSFNDGGGDKKQAKLKYKRK